MPYGINSNYRRNQYWKSVRKVKSKKPIDETKYGFSDNGYT